MTRLILSEIIRIFKKTSFKILLVLLLVSSFLTCYISNKKVNNNYQDYIKVELNNKSINLIKKYNKYAINQNKINKLYYDVKLNKIMDNGITLLIFSSIVIIVISSSILGNEINKKSIKELLTKPYRRCKILGSKYLAMYTITFLLTLFIFISYTIFTCILTKIDLFILKDYMIYNNHIIRTSFVIKYLYLFLLNSVSIYFISTLTIFLTTLISNQKIVIPIVSILFIMSPAILSFFLNINFKYIIYTFIPYLDFSIFKNAYSILMLNIQYNMNFNMINGIIILFGYSLLFVIISLYVINKKDFY